MSISASAVLVDLSISVWAGRKLDKKVSQEVDSAKNTKTRAGNYHKQLLAGSKELANIASIGAAARIWHYSRTMPWSDSGTRLLPTSAFMDYKAELAQYMQQFDLAVKDFLDSYAVQVSAAAFTMGDLFDRNEYPDVNDIANKFKFVYTISPVPEAGDFRVDVTSNAMMELASSYRQAYEQRTQAAMADVWNRVFSAAEHLVSRLSVDEDGKKAVFKESTIEGMYELIGLLNHLNVTKDAKLDAMRTQLEQAMLGTTAEDLRKDDYLREKVREGVADILDKFRL